VTKRSNLSPNKTGPGNQKSARGKKRVEKGIEWEQRSWGGGKSNNFRHGKKGKKKGKGGGGSWPLTKSNKKAIVSSTPSRRGRGGKKDTGEKRGKGSPNKFINETVICFGGGEKVRGGQEGEL